jgi:AcrR family transcriptional regulator
MAVRLLGTRGWQGTTLRDVAAEAGVSVGLLYRYFPSKHAVVLRLYDELSATYADQAASMASGRWRDRFLFALGTSLDVLRPHRGALLALVPVLLGGSDTGIFAPATAFSRLRVEQVFRDAVTGAADAPRPEVAAALGRLLYLLHLAIILWWLLDKSPGQRATERLIGLLADGLPLAALGLRVPRIRAAIVEVDDIIREALFTDNAIHNQHA